VSWNDVAGFNTATGLRLPTEAEWEYAYRAGTTTAFHDFAAGGSGGFNDDSRIGNIAWYAGNAGSTTHPVASLAPNGFGFYDMSGNVREWCNDWYSSTYYTFDPSTDPTGPSSGSLRVLRGGDWGGYSYYCRSSYRIDEYRRTPDYRDPHVGFRVARTPVVSETLWYTVLESSPSAIVVSNSTLREQIIASGFPWRVRDIATGIEMLLVPPGTFQMGCNRSNDSSGLCNGDESPRHQVTLTKAFYLGKTEVTQSQWQNKMGSNPSRFNNCASSSSSNS